MSKIEVLKQSSFGERTAEEESDSLDQYFVETDEWRQLFRGEDDIIYGPKGSGKSALYALLSNRRNQLFDRGTLLLPAENVRGTPIFRDLVDNPPATENELRRLWKLYFLSLIGHAIRDYGIDNEAAERLESTLEDANLLPKEWSLRRALRAVRSYISRLVQPEAVEGGVELDPATGQPTGLKGKIVFGEPTLEQRDLGLTSVDDLLHLADRSLSSVGYRVWIVLDRLDVAFASSKELEGNALRALFRVYLDMQGLEYIATKIFLRDDIWSRISSGGFREASHITRSITIRWDKNTLLNLIVRRLLRNDSIAEYLDVDPEEVLDDIERQRSLFYRVFPDQIDVGKRKPTSLDWMLSRIVDASDENVPRELIHLLTTARTIQIKRLQTGFDEPSGENLFDRGTFRDALPEVSQIRLENTLYAEYPDLKPWLEALEGEKTKQYPETLAEIWDISQEEALARAKRLNEVGFYEMRGTNQDPSFWTPFLYRPALNLSQGSASRTA